MPVTAEGFAAALERLAAPPHLAVAVSGGADSTALALLTLDFCTVRGGAMRAYIVDHGLRPESAAEAALTASRLAAQNIDSRVLTISLPQGGGVQARARAARHAVLAQAAAQDGFLFLLLGHHAADQEETVAMRAVRGDSGLEGMAAWSARDSVVLLRPLLATRPEALRAYLRARGVDWAEDPSNFAQKFERVRVRLEGTGRAPQSGTARAAREAEDAAFLAENVEIYPAGYALLRADSAPPSALAVLLRVIGGSPYAPPRNAVATLAAQLRPSTLGGVRCLRAGRLGPGWLLVREPAACAPPVPAAAHALWDGRFRLHQAHPGYALGALGADAAAHKRHGGLPSAILRTQPCLRGPDNAMIFPVAAVFSPPAPLTLRPFFT